MRISRLLKPYTRRISTISASYINIMLWCAMIGYLLIAWRIVALSLRPESDISEAANQSIQLRKANIVDRNGMILATDVETASLYAHPEHVKDIESVADSLQDILKLPRENIVEKLRSGKKFVWLQKHISPKQRDIINNFGIPGLYFAKSSRRFYASGNDFSHIIGFTNVDGDAVCGIEKAFEERLRANPNHALQVSMDARLQYAIRQEIANAVEINEAKGGACIVMNVNTGEILSAVSIPDFNPHKIVNPKGENMFNAALSSVVELGSLMKILTAAMALNEGAVKTDDIFYIGDSLKIGNFRIRDYRGVNGNLSFPEIIMYSSNIGTVEIARRLGAAKHEAYLKRSGLFAPISEQVPEIGKPVQVKHFSETTLAAMSYGYGIATTPLHLMRAFAATVNGGYLRDVTFLKAEKGEGQKEAVQIFSDSTSKVMRQVLRLVAQKGSVRRANVDEYLIGGKSGTAEKIGVNKIYDKNKNISSLIIAMPMHNPEILIYAHLDEPTRNAYNKGFITGGAVLGPVLKKILLEMGRILDMKVEDRAEALEYLYLNYPHQRGKK